MYYILNSSTIIRGNMENTPMPEQVPTTAPVQDSTTALPVVNKTRSKTMIALIISLIVLLLAAVGVIVWLLLGKNTTNNTTTSNATDNTSASATDTNTYQAIPEFAVKFARPSTLEGMTYTIEDTKPENYQPAGSKWAKFYMNVPSTCKNSTVYIGAIIQKPSGSDGDISLNGKFYEAVTPSGQFWCEDGTQPSQINDPVLLSAKSAFFDAAQQLKVAN